MPDQGRPIATTRRSGGLADALLAGAPDAITSGWCLWVWLNPLVLGADTVMGVVLMLLMEFFLLNATGFFTAIPFMIKLGRRTRIAMLWSLCAIYLLLVVAFALPFHAIWPYFAFGWLVLGKLIWILRNRRVNQSDHLWLIGGWVYALIAYLGAVGVGVTLDLPRLGITASIVPSLHLRGGGTWIHAPHDAVATAVFYFAALALFKWLHAALRKTNSYNNRAPPLWSRTSSDLPPD